MKTIFLTGGSQSSCVPSTGVTKTKRLMNCLLIDQPYASLHLFALGLSPLRISAWRLSALGLSPLRLSALRLFSLE